MSLERFRVSRERAISSATHLFGLLLHLRQSQLFLLLSILYSLLDFIPFADFVLVLELLFEGELTLFLFKFSPELFLPGLQLSILLLLPSPLLRV